MPRVGHPDQPATIRTDENVPFLIKGRLFVVVRVLSGARQAQEHEQEGDTLSSAVSHVPIIRQNGWLAKHCPVRRRWRSAGELPPVNWFDPPGGNRKSDVTQ